LNIFRNSCGEHRRKSRGSIIDVSHPAAGVAQFLLSGAGLGVDRAALVMWALQDGAQYEDPLNRWIMAQNGNVMDIKQFFWRFAPSGKILNAPSFLWSRRPTNTTAKRATVQIRNRHREL
jgi:hypothetical protein